jgi:dGTPase
MSEYHPYDGGMRLTYATLASFLKYPWTSSPAIARERPRKEKFGVFTSELGLFHEIASKTGLIPQAGSNWYCRHPLVALMEAADDFCYAILDLEDGLEMGILTWEEVFSCLKIVLSREDITATDSDLRAVRDGRKPPILRGKVIDACVIAAANAFYENEEGFLNGEDLDLVDLCKGGVSECVKEAKQIAKKRIFTHPRKVELEIGAYHVMSTLLEVMCTAVKEYVSSPSKVSFKCQRVLDLIGPDTFDPRMRRDEGITPEYLALMRVLDFVSGCTDHYATYLAKQFNGMGEAR